MQHDRRSDQFKMFRKGMQDNWRSDQYPAMFNSVNITVNVNSIFHSRKTSIQQQLENCLMLLYLKVMASALVSLFIIITNILNIYAWIKLKLMLHCSNMGCAIKTPHWSTSSSSTLKLNVYCILYISNYLC